MIREVAEAARMRAIGEGAEAGEGAAASVAAGGAASGARSAAGGCDAPSEGETLAKAGE